MENPLFTHRIALSILQPLSIDIAPAFHESMRAYAGYEKNRRIFIPYLVFAKLVSVQFKLKVPKKNKVGRNPPQPA